jgi:hypothetical protein
MGNDFDGFRDSRPGRSSRPSGRMDTLPGVAPPARGSVAPPEHTAFGVSMSTPRPATSLPRQSERASAPGPRAASSAPERRRAATKASIILLLTLGVLLGCMLALMSVLSQKGGVASGSSVSLPAGPVAETRGVTVKPQFDKAAELPPASVPKKAATPSDTAGLSGDRGPLPSVRAACATRTATRRAQKNEPERRSVDQAPTMPRMAEVSPRSF